MSIRHGLPGLATVSVCLVFGLGACGSDSGSGSADDPSASEVTPSGVSSAGAAAEDLVEGVYRTDPLTADQIRAAGTAAGFSEADVDPFATFFKESVVYELVLADGSWTQWAIVDGGAPDVGWRGTYEVTDGGTVVASDECGDITYGYAVDGDVLSIDVLDDKCPGADELIAQTTIYESGPFTHQAEETESASAGTEGVVHEASSFVVPFTITLASWLDPAPAEESPNFVTWEALDQQRGLRILSPVELYRPGQSEAEAPPKDYSTYLMSLADAGAALTDVTDIEVGGRSAKELTVGLSPDATPGSLDGALGCPEPGLDAESCFGPQDDLILRLVVIDVDGTPVLVWERDFSDAAGTIDYAPFDQMVASLRFS
jgi:hypothetical protein